MMREAPKSITEMLLKVGWNAQSLAIMAKENPEFPDHKIVPKKALEDLQEAINDLRDLPEITSGMTTPMAKAEYWLNKAREPKIHPDKCAVKSVFDSSGHVSGQIVLLPNGSLGKVINVTELSTTGTLVPNIHPDDSVVPAADDSITPSPDVMVPDNFTSEMGTYRMRNSPSVHVQAFRWFKNGDHPDDDVYRPYEDTGEIPKEPREGAVVRYFRDPKINGSSICVACGQEMGRHGWVDNNYLGVRVCPGYWVVTHQNGEIYTRSHDRFKFAYERVL